MSRREAGTLTGADPAPSRRYERFRGLPPAADAKGHALPSDRHARRVTVRFVCGGSKHAERTKPRVLAGFFVYSWDERFDSRVNEEMPNVGVVDRSFVEDEHGGHQRYLLRCPFDGCGRTPSFRADTVDRWLAEAYEQGAFDKIVHKVV